MASNAGSRSARLDHILEHLTSETIAQALDICDQKRSGSKQSRIARLVTAIKCKEISLKEVLSLVYKRDLVTICESLGIKSTGLRDQLETRIARHARIEYYQKKNASYTLSKNKPKKTSFSSKKSDYFINTRIQIDPGIKRQVETLFQSLYDGYNEKTKEIIAKNIEEKINDLNTSNSSWERKLSRYAEILYKILLLTYDSKKELSQRDQRIISASLQYLLAMDDVIPDYEVGIGYLDDAYIINKCIKNISEESFQLFLNILSKSRRK